MTIFSLLVYLFLFGCAASTVFKVVRSKKSSSYGDQNPPPPLPPGPWTLPLIGNIHNLIGCVPHHGLRQLALKHGPFMLLWLGEIPAVIVSSADAAKEVMKTHDINFASRPSIMAAEIMGYGCAGISFAPHGDYWRQLRKICTLELLSAKRVQSFRSLREKVYTDLIKWIASMEGSPLNLSEKLFSTAHLFIATAALGKLTEEGEKLLPIITQALKLAAGFHIAEFYPSVPLFRRMSGLKRKLSALHAQADTILELIIQTHTNANDADADGDVEYLVDVLLKYQNQYEIPLTTDNIKAVLLDVFGAGSETSATTMDWAMAEMVKNPIVMKKAQDEVRQVFDEGKGFVDESFLHRLTYLKSVVKETLRMHPPVPLLLPRVSAQTCEINGYQIPAHTKTIVNAWAINRDPKYWDDPDCFQPERFLHSSVNVDFRGNSFEYIPFGAGRRICPGISFGLVNVELPLAMFLYHFDWKFEHPHHPHPDMTEAFGMTARRSNDLFLVPIIKRPLPPLLN